MSPQRLPSLHLTALITTDQRFLGIINEAGRMMAGAAGSTTQHGFGSFYQSLILSFAEFIHASIYPPPEHGTSQARLLACCYYYFLLFSLFIIVDNKAACTFCVLPSSVCMYHLARPAGVRMEVYLYRRPGGTCSVVISMYRLLYPPSI